MRYALALEYDGSQFCGWQSQNQGPSVQRALESAISVIANQSVRVQCAGRTDSGVHATMQVVHFDADCHRHNHQWIQGVNCHLPPSVSVVWAQAVPEAFDARFSAHKREYRYLLLANSRRSLFRDFVGLTEHALCVERMRNAAAWLVGCHDFSSFRAAGCSAHTARRTIHHIHISQRQPLFVIDFCANAYLYKMIRNIVGSLIAVGSGVREPEWMHRLLESQDRTLAAPTALASGLYLTGVHYHSRFVLPQSQRLPVIGI